jgi:leucyl aminopeptidase (aminopeptidase T)
MPSSTPSLSRQVARKVLTETLRVKPGENVTIEAWSESLPWAVPFVNEVRRLGARPLMLYEDEASFWEALAEGNSRSTGVVGRHEWSALNDADAYVFFFGPSEWPRYDDLTDRKTEGVAAYNGEWYSRAAKAKIRGARMQIGRTSPLAAERWNVDLREWRTALQRASLASPTEMHRLATRIGRRLQRGRSVRVTHPNGTDLEFRLGRYPLQVDDGLVDAADVKSGNNMATVPGGVVGVAIDHTSAKGSVLGNHTVYPNAGPAKGISWTFRRGHLTDYAYKTGGPAFSKAYRAAPPAGRDRLSYVSIGVNPLLAGCPQMEDQELGAVMFRIGGNVFSGGKNASPFGSWMVLSGADVHVDGRPLLKGGAIA